MRAIGFTNGYTTGKVYLIWEIPHDKINYYEVWRGNTMIASTNTDEKGIPTIHTDLEKADPFVHPCLFDHDHHTNLFWKDSNHQLMYIDEDVQKFQDYEYHIVARRIDDNGDMQDMVVSDKIYVQTQ